MTLEALGALVGLLFGAGLLLVADSLRTVKPRLEDRVLPYVPEVAWYLRHDTATASRDVGARGIRHRLARAGVGESVADFRVEQLLWGAVALTVAAAVWFLLGGNVVERPGELASVCGAALLVGVATRSVALVSQARTRDERRHLELPLLAEMLATSVGAGLTLDESLRRCLAAHPGYLAQDLGEVTRAVEDGVPLARALGSFADTATDPQVGDFAYGLAVALERGTPLVDVLDAQTLDVRAARTRDLLGAARRRSWLVLVSAVLLGAAATLAVLCWAGTIAWTPPSWWSLP